MSQLIVFVSKAPVGERSHKVYVTNFESVEDFHRDLRETITEGHEDFPVLDLETFTQKLEELPVNLSTPDDTPNVTIEAVLKFDNIPPGRDLVEVVSAIYYVCSQHGLVDGIEIKRGRATMDVLSDPDEILDPKTFDWNIRKLINQYRQVLWLSTFMDFRSDGSPYPDISDLETTVGTAVAEVIKETTVVTEVTAE